MRQFVCSSIMGLIVLLSFFSNWYTPLCISLLLLLVIMMLYKIGRGIVLLEVTAVLYVLTCLIMPLAGYEFYSADNRLSRLWVKYMVVSRDVYFSYALPAIGCFCLAVTWPAFKNKFPDEGNSIKATIGQVKHILSSQKNMGLQIMLVGMLISLITKFLPVSVSYFAILFFFGSFAGILYIHFSGTFKYKKLVLVLFSIFILWNALQTGMFTIVAYMGITIFSFFQLGKKSYMLRKIGFLLLAVLFFIVLQNVKLSFRNNTWKNAYQGNRVELFANLFIDNLQMGDALISKTALFPMYSRTNQGYNVALVMRRIPTMQPYDNGDRLLTVFASAFVPRFLWQDKPEAGGKFNMKYYAGWNIVGGWSTNVGPLGEAYGSFGPEGGIVYMFVLGLFLRMVYLKVFKLAAKIPLLICWLPVLFYLTISSAETDSLQILNSIVKSAFFLWLLIKLLPGWFGIVKTRPTRRLPVNTLPA